LEPGSIIAGGGGGELAEAGQAVGPPGGVLGQCLRHRLAVDGELRRGHHELGAPLADGGRGRQLDPALPQQIPGAEVRTFHRAGHITAKDCWRCR
jgi:hypothetical protein